MLVNLDDVTFWMDAVRNSENHFGVLESFWKGQIKSKVWLIEKLTGYTPIKPLNIVIHGGWNGVLSSLLFNSRLDINDIRSIDIDPSCEETANTICKRHEMTGKFTAITTDMCEYKYEYEPDVVINTSTEHITQEQYNLWLSNVPDNCLVVLQNNNYKEVPDHVRCYDSLHQFADNSGLGDIMCKDTLKLPLYDRYLLIGRK
jgi:hypothetical protein